jgi:stage II sporulation protein D
MRIDSPITIEVISGGLKATGQPGTHSALYVSGNYRLTSSQHPAFEAAYPLELSAHNNTLQLIANLPLEEYVAAVLAGESGNQQSDQSLQAMAVAIRTFAVHSRRRHKAEGFDFCDTTHCQDFRASAVNDGIRAAAEATEGELLWYQGQPAVTYYHQNCGGNVADAADVWPGPKLPYLRQHTDPYCVRGNGNSWRSAIKKGDLSQALRASGLAVPESWSTLQVSSRSPTSRALQLQFTGAGSSTLSASTFRFAVNRSLGWNQIRSDLYEIRDGGDELVFTGHGSGHGVGLCQTGAEEMGRQGKSYREILAFYYPGTTLGVTAQGLMWQVENGEHIELVTTGNGGEAAIIPIAEKLIHEIEASTGMTFDIRPRLKVYPTLDAYRDSTGEPGWVAATVRGRTIRMQPYPLLRSHLALTPTLRHELYHLLIEAHAVPGLPVWFREGLVLYLASPAGSPRTEDSTDSNSDLGKMLEARGDRRQTEAAYDAARTRVASLVQTYGKGTVLSWLNRGIPVDVARTTAVGSQQ